MAEQPGGHDDALKNWLLAVEVNPQYAEAIYNLGVVLYRAGYSRLATTLWSEVVRLDPEFTIAWYNLGALAYRSGNVAESEARWRHCGDRSGLLPYPLFHVIVDPARTARSLDAPEELCGPVRLTCLTPDRLLSAIARATKWQSVSDRVAWLDWLPEDARCEALARLPGGMVRPRRDPDAKDALEVIEAAVFSTPASHPLDILRTPPTLSDHLERFGSQFCNCVRAPRADGDLGPIGLDILAGRYPVQSLRSVWPAPGLDWGAAVPHLRLEVAQDLLPLIYPECAPLPTQVDHVRCRLHQHLGITLPTVTCADNLRLAPGGYRILSGDSELGAWNVRPAQSFRPCEPARDRDPVFGLSGVWTDCGGNPGFHAAPYILNHLLEVARDHADLLLGHEETQWLAPRCPVEFIPILCTVLRHLLREGVPVGGVHRIVGPRWRPIRSVADLVVKMRRQLKEDLCRRHFGYNDTMGVLRLSISIERQLTRMVYELNGETVLDAGQVLPHLVRQQLLDSYRLQRRPVVVPPRLRPALKRFLVEGGGSRIPVISTREIPAGIPLTVRDTLRAAGTLVWNSGHA